MRICAHCSKPITEDLHGNCKYHHACSIKRVMMSYKCSQIVLKAIRRGELKRADEFECVDCGKPAYCYDHRDYSKPLDVDPVCNGCNIRRGPAIASVAA